VSENPAFPRRTYGPASYIAVVDTSPGSPDRTQPSHLSGTAMRSTSKLLVSFLKAEDGPTAVEYAVMLALIIVVCIAAVTTIGSTTNSTFSFVGSAIKPTAGS
jgi:pilus assembly protein Flp/PilA